VNLYQERSPSRRAWLIFLGICASVWTALLLVSDLNPAFPTILVTMLGVIAALTMWSNGLYGNITLTETHLRAGRARIPLADLHPWGVSRPQDPQTGTLVGGAWGATMGKHVVSLTKRNGTRILVQTSDPDALRAALNDALTPFRAEVR
jgi:hypothetical protein